MATMTVLKTIMQELRVNYPNLISGSNAQPSAVGMDQLLQKIDKLSLEVEKLRKFTPQNT